MFTSKLSAATSSKQTKGPKSQRLNTLPYYEDFYDVRNNDEDTNPDLCEDETESEREVERQDSPLPVDEEVSYVDRLLHDVRSFDEGCVPPRERSPTDTTSSNSTRSKGRNGSAKWKISPFSSRNRSIRRDLRRGVPASLISTLRRYGLFDRPVANSTSEAMDDLIGAKDALNNHNNVNSNNVDSNNVDSNNNNSHVPNRELLESYPASDADTEDNRTVTEYPAKLAALRNRKMSDKVPPHENAQTDAGEQLQEPTAIPTVRSSTRQRTKDTHSPTSSSTRSSTHLQKKDQDPLTATETTTRSSTRGNKSEPKQASAPTRFSTRNQDKIAKANSAPRRPSTRSLSKDQKVEEIKRSNKAKMTARAVALQRSRAKKKKASSTKGKVAKTAKVVEDVNKRRRAPDVVVHVGEADRAEYVKADDSDY